MPEDGCYSSHVIISSSGRCLRTQDAAEHEAHYEVCYSFNFKKMNWTGLLKSIRWTSLEMLCGTIDPLVDILWTLIFSFWLFTCCPLGLYKHNPTDKDIKTSISPKGLLKRTITVKNCLKLGTSSHWCIDPIAVELLTAQRWVYLWKGIEEPAVKCLPSSLESHQKAAISYCSSSSSL